MKKKIIIPIIIAFAVMLTCVTAAAVFANKGYSLRKGLYLSANGQHMIICDNSPIVMKNCTSKERPFEGISDGDNILILHDGIRESYPGGTGVYFIKKLDDGDISVIPEAVIKSLTEMGWLKSTTASDKKVPTDIDFNLGSAEYGICPTDPRPNEEVKLIRSTEDLNAHWDSVRNNTILTDTTDKYNEEYFENNYLLLVYVFGQSGMTEYTVEGIQKDGDLVTVILQSYTPSVHTDDCYATWIFFELSNDVDILNRDAVKVIINELDAFSYNDFLYFHDQNDPGLHLEGFVNTEPSDATAEENAVTLAKNELHSSFTYDTVGVSYDRFGQMWAITFSTEGYDGGGITVFLSTDGVTKAILAGE